VHNNPTESQYINHSEQASYNVSQKPQHIWPMS